MTDAIEAGARALLERTKISVPVEAEAIAGIVIEAAIASGALVPASAVVVKPLEWEQPDGPQGTAWLGHGTDMCQYYIRFDCETASYWMPGDTFPGDDDPAEEFLALDDAKASAQADYERRIRSALDLSPACVEYVVVPREPTPDMRIAGGIAWAEALPSSETYVDAADACYKAMLHTATRTGGGK